MGPEAAAIGLAPVRQEAALEAMQMEGASIMMAELPARPRLAMARQLQSARALKVRELPEVEWSARAEGAWAMQEALVAAAMAKAREVRELPEVEWSARAEGAWATQEAPVVLAAMARARKVRELPEVEGSARVEEAWATQEAPVAAAMAMSHIPGSR